MRRVKSKFSAVVLGVVALFSLTRLSTLNAQSTPTARSSDAGIAAAGPRARAERSFTLGATGDILVHRAVVSTVNAHAREGGFRWVLSGIEQSVRDVDIAFTNLESPLTERFHSPANATPPVLGAPTEYGHSLVETGFDVFSLANNHSYDQAGDGLAITLDALVAEHVVAVGAGRSEQAARAHVVVHKNGLRVAFLAATDRLNNGSSPNRAGMRVFLCDNRNIVELQNAIARARAESDVVVLSIHWSHDFVLSPTQEQRTLASDFVRWGADVVLGTGPHILQTVDRIPSPRGEAVVAYSLGNLISNQGYRHRVGRTIGPTELRSALDNPMTRDVLLLRVGIEQPNPGRVRIAALEAIPFWNENHVGTDDIHLVRLREMPAPLQQERTAAITRAVGAAVRLVN